MNPLDLNRRALLTAALASVLLPRCGRGSDARLDPLTRASDPDWIEAVRAALPDAPEGTDLQVRALGRRLTPELSAGEVRRHARARIDEDLAAARFVSVAGWELPEAEAMLWLLVAASTG